MRRFSFSVTSPVSPLKIIPHSMVIRYSEYMHDVLTFTAKPGSTSLGTPFVSGLPIRAQWSCAPSSGNFHGYIDKVESRYQQLGGSLLNRSFVVRCLGTSYPLKSEDFATYRDDSVSDVLRDIAKRFQLASMIETHDVPWLTLAQGGKSWWSFAVALAKRVGYTLFTRDAALYAVDRRTAIGNEPAITYRLTSVPQGIYDVIDFTPHASSGSGLGDDPPGAFVVRGKSSFSGVEFVREANTDTRYTGQTDVYRPVFQRIVEESPRTLAEAQTHLDAAVSRGMFTQRAKMTMIGNAALRVGSVIKLNAPYDAVHNGTWLVIDAEHRLMVDRYETVVELGKDAPGVSDTPPARSVSFPHGRMPGVMFRNGTWTAEWGTP